MELGKKIKYYRNEKSLTQDNLAERIFVSRQTISNWENDALFPCRRVLGGGSFGNKRIFFYEIIIQFHHVKKPAG